MNKYELALAEIEKRYNLGKADYMYNIPEYVEALGIACECIKEHIEKEKGKE